MDIEAKLLELEKRVDEGEKGRASENATTTRELADHKNAINALGGDLASLRAMVGKFTVPLAPPAAAAAAGKKLDAWGKPLDGSGKVVALPPARPPAPAPVAGQAPACSCFDHEPDHQKQGCAVKGCSCSVTA
jgi:hypothetical protein